MRYAAAFAALLAWYARHGRAALPWRCTRDPYAVVVSEAMLQQTQVERVRDRYAAFLARWPSFAALAAAERADVVRAWAGLGYNARAVRLHRLATAVVAEHGGVLPHDRDALLALPGVGPYTAAAVRAFAFDRPDVALDTNLRRVLHRVGFGIEHPRIAEDRTLVAEALAALPTGAAHDVNSALMDLGATVCTARAPRCLVCPLREACAAAPLEPALLAAAARAHAPARTPQAALPFERTMRFLRGRIVDALRALEGGTSVATGGLRDALAARVPPDRLDELPAAIDALERDGIVVRDRGRVRLA